MNVYRIALAIFILAAAWLMLRRRLSADVAGKSIFLLSLDALPLAAGWGIFLGLTARPMSAALTVATLAMALRLGDAAKRRTSGEPLVFNDGLQVSVVFHPILYREFISPFLLAAGLLAIALVCLGVGGQETRLWQSHWPAFGVVLSVIACWLQWPSAATLVDFLRRRGVPAATGDPEQDSAALGPLATVILHAATASLQRPALLINCAPGPSYTLPRIVSPPGPIVMLQLESFFDARRLGQMVSEDLLPI